MVTDPACKPSPFDALVEEFTPDFASNLEHAGVSPAVAFKASNDAGKLVKERGGRMLAAATKKDNVFLKVSPGVRAQIGGDAKKAFFDRIYILMLATYVEAALEALDKDECKGDHSQIALECSPLTPLYAPDGTRLRDSPPRKVLSNIAANIEDAFEDAKDAVGDWLIAAGEWLKE